MVDIAVVRLAPESLEVLVCEDGSRSRDLALLGLERGRPGHWSGHVSCLEPVCSLLDRLGIHWGVYAADNPRTFAERLFAECPRELASELYAAVRAVLTRSAAATLELAVLDAAWASHGSRADMSPDVGERR